MSTESSPKAIPKDAVWFLLIYVLVWATYLTGTGLWFLLWPSNPWYAVMLLWVTFALGPAGGPPRRYTMRASPMVPRGYWRAGTPPPRLRRNFRMATRCLRMESPCVRTLAAILRKTGRLTLPGTDGAGRCCLPRNLLCHPPTIGCPRTFQQAPLERGTMDAVARSSRSSLPGAATALHNASTPASPR